MSGVTHILISHMLYQSSLLSVVVRFVYKDKQFFDESLSVTFCLESTESRVLLSPLHTTCSFNYTLCFLVSFQAVVLHTKTVMNDRFFK